MRWTYPGLTKGILLIIFSAVLTTIAACSPAPVSTPPAQPPAAPTASQPAAPSQYTISLANKTGVGDYLVDSKGMTLYYFSKDTMAKSNATAAIVQVWPVFYVTSISVPAALNAADFGYITRDDGTKQTTYKGWPLYYYAQDQAAGDTKGIGINSVWYTVAPTELMLAPSAPLPATQPGTTTPYSY